VLLINSKFLFHCHIAIYFNSTLTPQHHSLLFAVVTKLLCWMCHLKQTAVFVHWIAVYRALSSSLYNTHFLPIKHSIPFSQHSFPLYITFHSSLYRTQFLSIQHTIPVYTTHSSSLRNIQFLSIQHSISLYTALNLPLYKTQFLSIKDSILVYKTYISSL